MPKNILYKYRYDPARCLYFFGIKTITFDNGKEFAQHHKIAKDLNLKTYFTSPYTAQDKGTVENRIGVIRRFFPKKIDLREVSTERIKDVER